MRIKKKNIKGFTLVELIVVLVVLGVLLALLVPTLTGYIDKAKEKKYLLEARNVVVSAQTTASEDYAFTSGAYDITGNQFITKYGSDVLITAEVNGSISALSFVQPEPTKQTATIQSLTYIAKDGTKVLYNRDTTPNYQIDKSGESTVKPGAPTHAKDWPSKFEELLKKLGKTPTSSQMEKVINSLPALTDEESQMLNPNFSGVKGTGDTSKLAWCPREVTGAKNLGDSGYILAVCPKDGKQNTNAQLLYYKDTYYICLNKNPNSSDKTHPVKVDYESVTKNFELDKLNNAPSLSDIDLSTITGKTWVKYTP